MCQSYWRQLTGQERKAIYPPYSPLALRADMSSLSSALSQLLLPSRHLWTMMGQFYRAPWASLQPILPPLYLLNGLKLVGRWEIT